MGKLENLAGCNQGPPCRPPTSIQTVKYLRLQNAPVAAGDVTPTIGCQLQPTNKRQQTVVAKADRTLRVLSSQLLASQQTD
jgi:hypothetical protein